MLNIFCSGAKYCYCTLEHFFFGGGVGFVGRGGGGGGG